MNNVINRGKNLQKVQKHQANIEETNLASKQNLEEIKTKELENKTEDKTLSFNNKQAEL